MKSTLVNAVVLVVDDEPVNRAFVRNSLLGDWEVKEAKDGADAFELARSFLPDLIIMDIDMPGVDGWAATAAVRAADPIISGVPILAYTATRLSDDEILARGMDGRLPKPCSPAELNAALARWHPDGTTARAQALGEVFGQDEIGQLVARFREQLIEALTLLDAASADVPAHRIAGVAGTLGFAEVSASWLRLSEGDRSAREDARRDARLAIARIGRDFPAAEAARESR